MLRLFEDGLTSSETAEYLNDRDMCSPRGCEYSAELVWVTFNRYWKRLERVPNRKMAVGAIFSNYLSKLCEHVIKSKFDNKSLCRNFLILHRKGAIRKGHDDDRELIARLD